MTHNFNTLRGTLAAGMIAMAVSLSVTPTAVAVDRIWLPLSGNWGVSTNWSPNGVPGTASDDIARFQNLTLSPVTHTVDLGTDRTVSKLRVSTGASQVSTLNFDNLGISRELSVTGELIVGGRGVTGSAADGTFNVGNPADAGTQTIRVTDTTFVQTTDYRRVPFAVGEFENGTGVMNVNQRGNVIVGTAGTPLEMYVGVMSRNDANTAGTVTGTLNLNAGSFVAHATDLSVGRRIEGAISDANLGNGIGAINAHNFAGENLDITVHGTTYIGRGRTISTTLSSGTLRLGNPLNEANQTVRMLGKVEVGTVRHATGLVELNTNGRLEIGTSSLRSNVDIGVQGSNNGSTSFGTLDVNGGTFTGWIDLLQVGVTTATTVGNANVGRGRVDLSGVTLGSNGNLLDANSAHIGGRSVVSTGGVMDAEMTLGAGSARFGTLYLGRNVGNAADKALLTLNETQLEITTSATIGASGQVDVLVGGQSAGFELVNTSPTALTMAAGSSGYDITFGQDFGGISYVGTADNHSFILYGLKWEGNHVATLNAMALDGRLDWDDTTFLTGQFNGAASIFYDLATDATYVGMYLQVPEPSSALLLGLGLLGLVKRTRSRKRA